MSQFYLSSIFTLMFAILLLPTSRVFTQEISFNYTENTGDFSSDQFRTDLYTGDDPAGFIRLRNGEVQFGDGARMVSGYSQLALSPDRSFAGVLFKSGGTVTAEIYRTDGTLLQRISQVADYDPDDPSVKLYMLNNGSFIYRDNIAGFTYFDERGKEVFHVYNSTGSPDGESISELAATPFGKNIALINPKIFEGDDINSRIQFADRKGDAEELARFSNLGIESADWHESTRILLVHGINENDGTHYGIVLTYRGDILAEIDYEDNEIEELILSDCARYLTAQTTGRAMVHRISTGERIGSASFRQRIQAASFMPDGILTVITGTDDSGHLTDLRAHIIDLEERRVVREETSLETHKSPHFPVRLEYLGTSEYRLSGTSREIIIRHTL